MNVSQVFICMIKASRKLPILHKVAIANLITFGWQPLFLALISTDSYPQHNSSTNIFYSFWISCCSSALEIHKGRQNKGNKQQLWEAPRANQAMQSFNLKRVSIVHQLCEASLIDILSLMFQDGSLKSMKTGENMTNNITIISW